MHKIHVCGPEAIVIELESRRSRLASYSTFVPLIDGIIFDTGFAGARACLMRALEGRVLTHITNTHAHEDHAGNNQALAKATGLMPQVSARSIPFLNRPETLEQRFYRRLIWGPVVGSQAVPLGSVLQGKNMSFEVIPTPGHTCDHVCFFEREKGLLVGGDLYVSWRVRLARWTENAHDHMASLRAVCALKPRVFFCYHTGAIENPLPRLEKKLDFMEDLAHRIAVCQSKGITVRDTAQLLLGSDPTFPRFLSRGDFSSENLVKAFLKKPGSPYPADIL